MKLSLNTLVVCTLSDVNNHGENKFKGLSGLKVRECSALGARNRVLFTCTTHDSENPRRDACRAFSF